MGGVMQFVLGFIIGYVLAVWQARKYIRQEEKRDA